MSGLPVDVSKKHQVESAINPLSQRSIFQGATEGIVLLKNHNHTVRLKKPKLLTLYGYDAHIPSKNIPGGPNTKYSLGYQSVDVTDEQIQGLFIGVRDLPGAARSGTLLGGGGSASVVPAYITSPLAAFSQRAREDGTFLLSDFECQDHFSMQTLALTPALFSLMNLPPRVRIDPRSPIPGQITW